MYFNCTHCVSSLVYCVAEDNEVVITLKEEEYLFLTCG